MDTEDEETSDISCTYNESQPLLLPHPTFSKSASIAQYVLSRSASAWNTVAAMTITNKELIGLSCIMLLTASLNLVFLNKAARSMHPNGWPDAYPLLWVQGVLLPPLYGILLAIRWHRITREQRKLTQWQFMIMGALQMGTAFSITMAVPHVSGPVQVVLSANVVNVPLGSVVSFLVLQRRYTLLQFTSLIVVLLGIALSLVGDMNEFKHKVGKRSKHIPPWLWAVLFSLGSPFNVALRVFQERLFIRYNTSKGSQSVLWINFWLFSWQAIWICTIGLVLDCIPEYGTNSFRQLFPTQLKGLKCLVGIEKGIGEPETCINFELLESTLIQTACLFGTELLAVHLVKESSALLVFVITTVATPCSALLFGWHWLLHPFKAQPVSVTFTLALVVLVVGMLAFAFTSHLATRQQSRLKQAVDAYQHCEKTASGLVNTA